MPKDYKKGGVVMACECNQSGFCDFQMYGNHAVRDCPCYVCSDKKTCQIICKSLNNHHRRIFKFDHGDYKK